MQNDEEPTSSASQPHYKYSIKNKTVILFQTQKAPRTRGFLLPFGE